MMNKDKDITAAAPAELTDEQIIAISNEVGARFVSVGNVSNLGAIAFARAILAAAPSPAPVPESQAGGLTAKQVQALSDLWDGYDDHRSHAHCGLGVDHWRLDDAKPIIEALKAAPVAVETEGWMVAAGEMPKGNVLASMLYPNGKRRTVVAFYAGKFQIECGCDDGVAFELNEEDDEFYLREGWYECIQNWGDFSSVTVTEGTVTHWRPLPAAPLTAPKG